MEKLLSFHHHLLASTFFLLLLINSFFVVLSTDTNSINGHYQKQSIMDILKPLIGSRKGSSVKGLFQIKKYLSTLGYMTANNLHSNDDFFDDNLEKAIKDYQTYFKLNVNGVLDANTAEKMSQPRCGVPDVPKPYKTHLDHRYPNPKIGGSHYSFFPGSPKWPPTRRNLTYSFPSGTRGDTNKAILDATNLWASVSPFKFSYIEDYDKADIKISYEIRDHGDGNPFDGTGGILAHAFGPPDGRLHFDEDERWVDGVLPGSFDIQTVGLHELGHILGLLHTPDGGAIMYPYIGAGFRKGLAQDDINGIKELYK